MPDLVVVDLSHHNGKCDFAKAKAAGLVGVIHKATEGTTFVDEDYAARREAAVAAGLGWSSYHFLRHGDVQDQMQHYLDTVDPALGERVCIDYEHEDCTLDDLREAVDLLNAADLNLQVTVYAGHLIKEQLGNQHDDLLAGTSLWVAQYNSSGPSWPTGTWPTWTLWQYSDGSSGGSPKTIAGIPSPNDCNAFNGSRANCALWFGPAGTEPGPTPAPEPEEKVVIVDLVVPDGVKVAVTVNGEALT